MKVAVMSAAGWSRTQIVKQLGADELEVKMAMVRLKRVTEAWV